MYEKNCSLYAYHNKYPRSASLSAVQFVIVATMVNLSATISAVSLLWLKDWKLSNVITLNWFATQMRTAILDKIKSLVVALIPLEEEYHMEAAISKKCNIWTWALCQEIHNTLKLYLLIIYTSVNKTWTNYSVAK